MTCGCPRGGRGCGERGRRGRRGGGGDAGLRRGTGSVSLGGEGSVEGQGSVEQGYRVGRRVWREVLRRV